MATKKPIRLPTLSERTLFVGRTGSGKTQAAVWHLSQQPLENLRVIVLDFKRDELVNSIEKAQYITFEDSIPKKPGIYILQVMPGEEVELEDFLWKIYNFCDGTYEKSVLLYVDEATMIKPNNRAFNSLLTQGRSKKAPVFICTQRPVWLSVYCFSEASFYQIFDLTKKGDRERISDDVPISPNYDLEDYHSYYYCVADKTLAKLQPVPDEETILAKIDAKLPRRRRTI